MKKLDIMNMREGEQWVLIDGKEVRVEQKPIIVKDSVEKIEVKEVKKKVNKNGKK